MGERLRRVELTLPLAHPSFGLPALHDLALQLPVGLRELGGAVMNSLLQHEG